MSTLLRKLIVASWLAAPVAIPMSTVLDYVSANAQRDELLVSAEWLSKHLRDANLVLLHVGERKEYDAGHIPGAQFISMQDVSAPRPADPMSGQTLELPDPAGLRRRLETFGISDRSRIVVYYGSDWVSPSTRVVFTLDWIGLGDRTVLLNGGMPAWKANGGAIVTVAPVIKPGKLNARPVKSLVVDANWVQANARKPGYALIDGRTAGFYDGAQKGMTKAGHIPGARNIPFTTVTDDSLRLESPAQLRQLFERAGIKNGDTVVGYCHIGQQATAVLFAARTLGHKVLLYDGSFHDWEMRDLPVETPK
ncbi:MAG TPA: sulfurtransferase [Longimicrobiales bacterium]|nr:sulfurtransferase [Longimicrobiales bacterium]